MRLPVLLLPLALAACAGPVDGPDPVYEPTSGWLADAPWPTDDRLVDGALDLSGFPPTDVPLIERYLAVSGSFDGWGPSQPIYVPFRSLPPVDRLPDPEGSLGVDSGLVLADIDPDSPGYGTRVPVQWEAVPAGTLVPHPTLAVAPVFGFPLRPGTTHALVVTTDVAAPSERFIERLDEDPALAPLADALDDLGLARRDVSVGTVFTTRDPLADMDALVAATRALPAPDLSQPLLAEEARRFFRLGIAEAEAPLWQHGDKPYISSGGAFRFAADGTPEQAGWDPLTLAVSTPLDLTAPPADGYPVVVYAHGTGGSALGFADSDSGLEVASQLARAGLVGISFNQPLHGNRGTPNTDVNLHSFNYFNPEAARANFRQGALDIVWLIHALRSHDVTFTTADGTGIPLDTDRILFMGHSHGGLTGAIAGPWLGDDLQGAVLSGAGGGLAITLVKRKDPQDIARLIGTLLGFGPDETLTPLHPVSGLVQMLVEETDPINYAPYWAAEDRGSSGRSLPVLLTSGQYDLQTDHETTEALAAAAGLPLVDPAWNDPVALRLRGLQPEPAPLADNVPAFDGRSITGALSQWEEGDHFVIFQDSDASMMARHFLETAARGRPEVDPYP